MVLDRLRSLSSLLNSDESGDPAAGDNLPEGEYGGNMTQSPF